MTNISSDGKSNSGDILFVGGGVSGLTSAIEAAEVGKEVIVVEKNPYVGGRVLQLNQYFPKLCPPSCGLEINFKRIRKNPRIKIITLAEIDSISGEKGNYDVTVKKHPRYVNDLCTSCDKCVEPCPETRPNEFNFGMDTTKAIYLPHESSFPMQYAIDMDNCKGKECGECVKACPYNAIDLDMQPETFTINVKSIVWATGWKPYDAEKIDILGYGKYPNVITNMMMERLAAPNGPTKGKILRPSDNKEPKKVVFVQCAGSRDENHLPYCSAVCCLASMKQSSYVREQYPDADITIAYIDVRSPGRLEDFYNKTNSDEKITFKRGKVASITEDTSTKNLIVKSENTMTGTIAEESADLVVLATGIVPNTKETPPANVKLDDNGFIVVNGENTGIYGAGMSVRPMEVSGSIREGMGATLKALQAIK